MVYQSAISNINKYIYLGVIILLLLFTIPAFFEATMEPLIVVCLIDFSLILCLVWIYNTTNYTLEDDTLFWKSGPFYGKIKVGSITKITHHKGIIVPTIWKPALSHIGLIITYNKYDDIYISPKNCTEFLEQLIRINPNITIKNTAYVK